MNEQGEVYIADTKSVGSLFRHNSFFAGGPVSAAGYVTVVRGVLRCINRISDYYALDLFHLCQDIDSLKSQGAVIDKRLLLEARDMINADSCPEVTALTQSTESQ